VLHLTQHVMHPVSCMADTHTVDLCCQGLFWFMYTVCDHPFRGLLDTPCLHTTHHLLSPEPTSDILCPALPPKPSCAPAPYLQAV
jgi:hypothetical protein